MVRGELEQLEGWFRSLAVKPTVTAIRARATELARTELERTWAKRLNHLGETERASMEKMVEAMVSKLLHPTMIALRNAGSSGDGQALVAAARTLHGVEDMDADGENT